jgi:hypothetical protein
VKAWNVPVLKVRKKQLIVQFSDDPLDPVARISILPDDQRGPPERNVMSHAYKWMESPIGLLKLVASNKGLAAALWEHDIRFEFDCRR